MLTGAAAAVDAVRNAIAGRPANLLGTASVAATSIAREVDALRAATDAVAPK